MSIAMVCPGASNRMPPAEEAPLTLRLRLGTRDMHDLIEANRRFARLMAPDLSRDEYRALVGRLFGHHAPAEAAIETCAALLPAIFDLPRRLVRRAALQRDLGALGMAGEAIEALPRCADYRIATTEQALGTLYVLEGATLGGQLIARHLAATLGLGPLDGAANVVPHGAETGAMWRQFRIALDEAETTDALDGDAVVAAARFAFETLDRWVAAA